MDMIDTEARARKMGAGNADIDAFLAKVNATESLIQGMKDGTLDPKDVRVPGELTPEEKAEKEAARARRAEQLRAGREREKAEAIVAEREKWWGHAELVYGDRDGRVEPDADAAAAEERVNRIAAAYTQRDANDYSQWGSSWEPKDPVTMAEQAEQDALAEKVKDAEFEKMNPEFCDKFKEDIVDRQRTAEMKRNKSSRLQKEGNKAFKKRRFDEALALYHEALALDNFRVALLTNIAQVHLKRGMLEDVVEFCDRALHVQPSCAKALSRRAAARRLAGDLDRARVDLDEAVRHDGGATEDLLKEQREVHALIRERELEISVTQRAALGEERKALSDLGLLQRMVEHLLVDVAEQYGEGSPEDGEEKVEEGEGEGEEDEAQGGAAGAKSGGAKKLKGKAAKAAKAAKTAKATAEQSSEMHEALEAAKAAAAAAGVMPANGGKADATAAICELLRMSVESDAGRAPGFMGDSGGLDRPAGVQSATELRVLLRTTGGLAALLKRLKARPTVPTAPEQAEGGVAAEGAAVADDASALPSLDPTPVQTLDVLRLAVDGDERNLKTVCREGGVREALLLLAEGGAEVHASGSVTAASVRGAALALLRACAASELCRSRVAKHSGAVLGLLEALFDWERPALVEDAAVLVQKLAGEPTGVEALRQAPLDVVATLAAALGASRSGIEGAEGGAGAVALMREELVGALAQLTLAPDMRARFAELALVGAAAGGGGSEDEDEDEDDASATPVVALLDVVRRAASCMEDRVRSKELALAALMNASCEPSGSVREQIVAAGGIFPLLAVLPAKERGGLSDVGAARAAGVLARTATCEAAAAVFQQSSVITRLAKLIGAGTNGMDDTATADQLHSHVVRVLAAALCSAEAVAAFRALDGVKRLLSLLPSARMGEVKTSAQAAAVAAAKARQEANAHLLGNAATLLTKCVDDGSGESARLLLRLGGVEQLITLLRDAKNPSVRKNVAICVARLARTPEAKQRITSLRGMEMLRAHSKELTGTSNS